MRSIFLCEKSDKIFSVYNNETVEKLQKLTNIEKKIYTKSDVLFSPALFSKVEFIFSTWGMPSFTEDEIKKRVLRRWYSPEVCASFPELRCKGVFRLGGKCGARCRVDRGADHSRK